jgi:hypothetical protein
MKLLKILEREIFFRFSDSIFALAASEFFALDFLVAVFAI